MGSGVSFRYSSVTSLRLKSLLLNPHGFNLPLLLNKEAQTNCREKEETLLSFNELVVMLSASNIALAEGEWVFICSILGIPLLFLDKERADEVNIFWKDVYEFLLSGKVTNIRYTYEKLDQLILASKRGDLSVLRKAWELGGEDKDLLSTYSMVSGGSCIYFAALCGQGECVAFLLERCYENDALKVPDLDRIKKNAVSKSIVRLIEGKMDIDAWREESSSHTRPSAFCASEEGEEGEDVFELGLLFQEENDEGEE